MSLFGLLILDREPFVLSDFLGLLQAWLQDAGGFAFVGLSLYFLYVMFGQRGAGADESSPLARKQASESERIRMPVTGFMLIMCVVAILTYAIYGFLLFTGRGGPPPLPPVDPYAFVKYTAPKFANDLQSLMLMIGGLCALAGIGHPFAINMTRLRFRRIWAIARLGYKEAIRSRMFWVFLLFMLPFMFPIKWFLPIKPEDELRSTIAWTTFFMTFLLLFPSAFLSSFGISKDIKDQNLYTVVTKPVERFEIILGRFLGYATLFTVALVGMTGVSWVLIATAGVDEKAREETYKARVPVRAKMNFASRKEGFEGTNVGREFDYRKYIGGDPISPQRAIWNFYSVPSGLTRNRDHVPCEFTFDIFRMTKGEENRGVDLDIRVVTWQCPQRPPTEMGVGVWSWERPDQRDKYEDRAKELLGAVPGITREQAANPMSVLGKATPQNAAVWAVAEKLAEEFGYFEVTGKEIFDYHPSSVAIPVGIFKNALNGSPKATDSQPNPPLVQVYVKCTTRGQLLGMAEGDLYLIEGEQPFALNYFKAAFGLWCQALIVLGLGVVSSTYVTGIIGALLTAITFLAGYATEHIETIATGTSVGGGPFQAVNQLLRAEQPTTQLDPTNPLNRAVVGLDEGFAWLVRRFVNMVPDVQTFGWTSYVSEGFSIPFECLVMNFLVTVAYLLPWFILGYYLMRSREVAA